MSAKKHTTESPQIAKFKELARQLEVDEDPDAFKAKLVRVARAPKPKAEPKRP